MYIKLDYYTLITDSVKMQKESIIIIYLACSLQPVSSDLWYFLLNHEQHDPKQSIQPDVEERNTYISQCYTYPVCWLEPLYTFKILYRKPRE